jgi:hypothetical protein
MLAEAKKLDYTKLPSTEEGMCAVTRWFVQWDILSYPVLAGKDNE